jgi:phage repressor protein C with HTH and peptisase S24 domain
LSTKSAAEQNRKKGWIPILGRTAAGIVHCWDETALPESGKAVTKLDQLVKEHTGKEICHSEDAPMAVDFELKELAEAVSNSKVSLVRTAGESQGRAVEFVECEPLYNIFPDCFALHVDGESMSPRVNDGDIVVMSPSVPAADGQMAVAHIENQIGVTCKLIRTTPRGVHLIPINEKYEVKIVPREDLQWALSVLCHINL